MPRSTESTRSPRTTTARVSRFDPLDRKWYRHATAATVSVPIAPTLRQLLKNLMRAAGQPAADARFRAVQAQDGIRLWLHGRGVQVEMSRLRHAEGTQVPEEVDGDGGAYSLDAFERAFPPACRKGWRTNPYTPSPESQRRLRAMRLAVRAMKDRDLCAALFAAAKQYERECRVSTR